MLEFIFLNFLNWLSTTGVVGWIITIYKYIEYTASSHINLLRENTHAESKTDNNGGRGVEKSENFKGISVALLIRQFFTPFEIK